MKTLKKISVISLLLILSSCGGGGGSDSFSWTGSWNVALQPATGNCFCNEAGTFADLPPLDVSESGRNIRATFCSGVRCLLKLYTFEGTSSDPDTTTPSFVASGSFVGCMVDDGTAPISTISFVQTSALEENAAVVSLDVSGMRGGVGCSSHFEGTANR